MASSSLNLDNLNTNARASFLPDTANVNKFLKLEMDKYPADALGPPQGLGGYVFTPTTFPFGLIEQPFGGGFKITPNTTPNADYMQIVGKMIADHRPIELGGDFSLTQLALFVDSDPPERDLDTVLDLVTINCILASKDFEDVSMDFVLKKFSFLGFGISTDWNSMQMGAGKRILFRSFNSLSYDFHGRQNIRNPGWKGRIEPGDIVGFTLKKVNTGKFFYRLSEHVRLKSEIEVAWQFVPEVHRDVQSMLKAKKRDSIYLPVATAVEETLIENLYVNYTDLIQYHSASLLNVFVFSNAERDEYMSDESLECKFSQ